MTEKAFFENVKMKINKIKSAEAILSNNETQFTSDIDRQPND